MEIIRILFLIITITLLVNNVHGYPEEALQIRDIKNCLILNKNWFLTRKRFILIWEINMKIIHISAILSTIYINIPSYSMVYTLDFR